MITLSFLSCNEIPETWDEMDLKQIAIEIHNEVGQARADDISQCRILPIGTKPCGGPWGYLVYSKKESNQKRLETLVDYYDKLDKIRNEEEGRISTCEVATPPILELREGKCHGTGRYAWNPGYILDFNDIDMDL